MEVKETSKGPFQIWWDKVQPRFTDIQALHAENSALKADLESKKLELHVKQKQEYRLNELAKQFRAYEHPSIKSPYSFTGDEDDTIIALYEKGFSIKEIAKIIDSKRPCNYKNLWNNRNNHLVEITISLIFFSFILN